MKLLDILLKKKIKSECKKYSYYAYTSCKEILSKIDVVNNQLDFSNYSREERRKIEKENKSIIRKAFRGTTIGKYKELAQIFNNIYSSFNNRNSNISSNDEFLVLTAICNSILERHSGEESEKASMILAELVKEKIIESKKNNISAPLLDCYDLKGELIEDKYKDFKKIINNFTNNYELERILDCKLNYDSILWCLDSDNKFRDYSDELKRKMNEEMKLRKVQKKEQAEKIRKESTLAACNSFVSTKNTVITDEEKTEKYINMLLLN